MTTYGFNDYLGLLDQDLSRLRWLVFTGKSGCGKSTYIQQLLRRHPDLRDREICTVGRGQPPLAAPRGTLVVFDEILAWNDLRIALGFLRRGHRVLAANHLPARLMAPLAALVGGRQYVLDRHTGKIAHYLQAASISYRPETIRAYCRAFGATYTDVDIILEACPADNFDYAYGRFMRFYASTHCGP